MRRIVLLSLIGIAVLLGGSLAVIFWRTDEALPPPAAETPSAVVEPVRALPVAPPPPAEVARSVEEFQNPAPKEVPEPPAPPPPVDLAREGATLEALVSGRCGRMQLRLGDEMRKGGDRMTGQAILLFDVESQGGKVTLGQSRQQSAGNMRPSLVACAQMALRGQVIDAPRAVADGERFVLQLVLGMKP